MVRESLRRDHSRDVDFSFAQIIAPQLATEHMSDLAISVSGLRMSYGALEAVKGIDFQVHAGEVFGLLGPNGAGKTTTVEILEGLRPRSGGEVTVLGFDPGAQSRQLKDRIGVCLQSTNLPEKIKVWEAIDLFGALYTKT